MHLRRPIGNLTGGEFSLCSIPSMEAFKVLSVMAGNDFPVHLLRVKGRTCQKSSILWVPDEGDSETDEEE